MSDGNVLKVFSALEKYPVYRHSAPDSLDILIVGQNEAVRQVMNAAITVCQMPERRLTVYCPAFSQEAGEKFKGDLLRRAPMIEQFSNLVRTEQPDALVYFKIPVVERNAKAIVEACPGVRWAVVGLDDEKETAKFAKELALELKKERAEPSVVLSTAMRTGDGVVSIQEDFDPEVMNRLYETACRIDFEYQRLRDPSANRRRCMENLRENEYNLLNSLVTTLHGYRLACFNLQDLPLEQAARAYAELVIDNDSMKRVAAYAEHNRWMMDLVLRGVRRASDEELLKSCFNGQGLNRFRYEREEGLYHNCLVPSDCCHERLDDRLAREEWDNYSSIQAVESDNNFDALDKVSLKCHLIARHILQQYRDKKDEMLQQLRASLSDKEKGLVRAARFTRWYEEVLEGKQDSRDRHVLDELIEVYGGKDDLIRLFEAGVAIAGEFYSYIDYKKIDFENIDAFIMIDTSRWAILKLRSNRPVEMVASTLLLDPAVVSFAVPEDEGRCLREFLRKRGDNVTVRVCDDLEKEATELQREGYRVIIDITGASAAQVANACELAARDKQQIGVILCNTEKQRVINVHNIPEVEAQRKKVQISAEEIRGLSHGAAKLPVIERQYKIENIRTVARKIYPFYLEKSDTYKTAAAMLKRHIVLTNNCIARVKKSNMLLYRKNPFTKVVHEISTEDFSRISTLLYSLMDLSIADDVQYHEGQLSIRIPPKLTGLLSEVVRRAGEKSFKPRIYQSSSEIAVADEELACFECPMDGEESPDKIQALCDTMSWLEQERLVSDTSFANGLFKFSVIEPALTMLLSKEGALFEAIVLDKAAGLVRGDLCYSQEIGWNDADELLCNEVDLLLVEGMTTMLLSCKDTSPKRTDIQEARIMGDLLDPAAKAYLITSRYDEINHVTSRSQYANLQARAKQMGVQLVLMDELLDPGFRI